MNILVRNRPTLVSVGNRHYRLENRVTFKILLDSDDLMIAPNAGRPLCIKIELLPNAVIDFRSGGPLVDYLCDQVPANPILCAAFEAHDVFYTRCYFGEHFCSREAADLILYKLLLLGGMPKWKASLIYAAVRIGGSAAYENDDEYTHINKHLFNISWRTWNG